MKSITLDRILHPREDVTDEGVFSDKPLVSEERLRTMDSGAERFAQHISDDDIFTGPSVLVASHELRVVLAEKENQKRKHTGDYRDHPMYQSLLNIADTLTRDQVQVVANDLCDALNRNHYQWDLKAKQSRRGFISDIIHDLYYARNGDFNKNVTKLVEIVNSISKVTVTAKLNNAAGDTFCGFTE